MHLMVVLGAFLSNTKSKKYNTLTKILSSDIIFLQGGYCYGRNQENAK